MTRISVFASACLLMSTMEWAIGGDGVSTEGVDQSRIAVHVERAFPKIKIDRPVLVMHRGDGTNRLVVASQLGAIYSMANDDAVESPDLMIDLTPKVAYDDKKNEEGLLGLAFHPKFKENGQFFVYYTSSKEPQLSVISRFSTEKGNPNKGDPSSEEVLLTIKQPYWNHNGGTLVFGPDGYLYIGMGDGGLGGDPLLSGQDLSTLLGKILRIDVDKKDPGMNYSIPKGNPFVGKANAKGEIYAYGFRNIWRMSFDRKNGDFLVADVGQDLWEEINVVTQGGNYGWSAREAAHPFRPKQSGGNAKMIDPIWEYPHNEKWGKSITGGNVYRGTKVPLLQGYYLYADYVSGKQWALKYDPKTKKVLENRVIDWPSSLPVVTFGEDEKGEVLFGTVTSGGMLYRYVEGDAAK